MAHYTNYKKYDQKRKDCKEIYLKGEINPDVLAVTFSVAPNTIRNWIRKGKWEIERVEMSDIDEQIEKQIKLAIKNALKKFNSDEDDIKIASLTTLLRTFFKTMQPEKELINYMQKFLRWIIEYFINNGEKATAEAIQQKILGDNGLVEYFKKRATNLK